MSPSWHPAVAAQSQQERLLRPEQAAARLECSPRWVRQLCQNKILFGIKKGKRKWLIPESAIRDYLSALNQE